MTIARAVGIARRGGLDVLEVIEREVREPGPGEVRLAVKAAAVNPTDIGLRDQGTDLEPPWTPGMDAAGTVESVGVGVGRLAVGDRVMAAVAPRRPEGGAQASLVVVPAASVVPVPQGASFEEAATLPMNGLTTLLTFDLLDLAPGQTIGVSGGAGCLASYVIPVAKTRGLRVIADAAPKDDELVRSFGADHILPRGEGFPAAVRDVVPDGVDGFVDTALLNRDAFPAIRDGGVLVPVRGWQYGDPERDIEIRPVLVFGVLERTDWLEEVSALAEAGTLRPRVDATYPPQRAADAQRAMEAGGLRGRAVIVF